MAKLSEVFSTTDNIVVGDPLWVEDGQARRVYAGQNTNARALTSAHKGDDFTVILHDPVAFNAYLVAKEVLSLGELVGMDAENAAQLMTDIKRLIDQS